MALSNNLINTIATTTTTTSSSSPGVSLVPTTDGIEMLPINKQQQQQQHYLHHHQQLNLVQQQQQQQQHHLQHNNSSSHLQHINSSSHLQHNNSASCLTLTPKMKRATASKKLQFSNPEYSVTQISTIPGTSNRCLPIPSRKREEAMVLANLRKRVAACDLTKRKVTEDPNANDTGQTDQQLDNRPLLPKVSSKRDMNNGEESPKPAMLQDKDFILDCLCWHNEYRARHNAPALTVSPELCEYAQQWANHLASTNEFYYRSDINLGQNLFCCPISALVTDLTGQEVASYWYSTVRRYNYFKEPYLLHTNVNAGHFTQMVWVATRYFGVGKQTSKTGKIFVVAYYFPAGNIVNAFQENVLTPAIDQDNLPIIQATDFDNNPIPSILKTSSTSQGTNSGITGVSNLN